MLAAFVTASPTPACTVNGEAVPCGQAFDHFGTFFLGFGLLFFLVFVFIFLIVALGLVLTIVMIVHAAQHEIRDRALWIVLMVLFSPIGAVIYYFAVKRPLDDEQRKPAPAPKRRPRTRRKRSSRSSRR